MDTAKAVEVRCKLLSRALSVYTIHTVDLLCVFCVCFVICEVERLLFPKCKSF